MENGIPQPTHSNTLREHERIEKSLTERTVFLNALIENSPLAIAVHDPQGRVQMCNPAFERLFGYSRREVMGASLDELIAPGGMRSEAAEITRRVLTGEMIHVTTGRRRKDGILVDVELHGVPLVVQGELVGAYGLYQDISARRRADEARLENEERFRSLFEEAPVAYHEIDRDGIVRRVNRAECALLGIEPREILGKPIWEFVAPEEREISREAVRRKISGEQPLAPFHREYVRRDGARLTLEIHENLIRDTKGVVVGVRSTLLDVTERKRAEEALRLSEEKFAKAFRFSPDSIAISTLAEGRLIDVNDGFLRVTGYQREEAIGRTAAELKLWVEPADRARLLQQLQEQGSVSNQEFSFRRKSGAVLDGLISAEIVDVSGERCLVTVVRDITERKYLEEQLRQWQKIEALGRLAGGVAHDFNNLLTVINGYSELLLHRLSPRHPLHEKIEKIHRAGDRAASLTRQLLAFSRQQVLQPQMLDFNVAVADAGELLLSLIGENIELVTVPGPALGRVKTDPVQIEQVILNLALNARDAMPHGGRLTIETANVELDKSYGRRRAGVQPGPYVMLAVSDTGCGMDAETQAHVFEPFFTTKEVGKGTGLGLAMVYGIVKQSGGYVWVYSEPGRGTTVKIYLPRIKDAEERLGRRQTRAAPPRGTETILLVEDEESVLELARECLHSSGYTVLEARHGDQALRISRRHKGRIHLLLTDVVMPGKSGCHLVRRLASLRPDVKVLYMSGYTDNAIVHHGVLDPGTAFLQKPFTAADLARKVRQVLDAAGVP